MLPRVIEFNEVYVGECAVSAVVVRVWRKAMRSITMGLTLVGLLMTSLSSPSWAVDGEVLYKRMCTSCHGYDGEGRSGLGPALRNGALTTGPLAGLIEVVREGREDTLMVAFKRNMPAEDLAAVITYVRRQFGNEPQALVLPEDVR